MTRRGLAIPSAVFALLALAGCAVLFDFGGYDTAREARIPPEAAPPGDGAAPFGIRLSPLAVSGTTGDVVKVRVAVDRHDDFEGVTALGLDGAREISIVESRPLDLAGRDIELSLRLGNKHGLQTFRVTATRAASTDGFTATASLDVSVRGKPGALDTSFGDEGVVATDLMGDANDVAVLLDDRILVAGTDRGTVGAPAGTFIVARFLSTGTPDLGFGSAGRATPREAISGREGATCIAVAAGDRALVAGNDALVSLLASGSRDPAFGDAGVVELVGADSGTLTLPCASMTVRADGRIVIAAGGDALRRLAGGAADPAFADGGRVDGLGAAGASLLDGGAVTIASVSSLLGGEAMVATVLSSDGTLVGRGAYLPSDVTTCPELARPVGLPDGRTAILGSCGTPQGAGGPLTQRRTVVLATSPDGGIDPTFAEHGYHSGKLLRVLRAGASSGTGLVTVETGTGASERDVVVTVVDAAGHDVSSFVFDATTKLGGMIPAAAITDHAMRLVIVGRGAGAGAFLARIWL